ncbi:hypothetical protein D3C87_1343180 [compost metagenome]
MRAIDSLRDAEQHWLLTIDETLLYLHARALVTAFDDVLQRAFDDALINHLPVRVLPVSSHAPQNVEVLMDREYQQIVELLAPGRRARDEARGRIRALLAMESHLVEEVSVSETDINRIEDAIRGGTPFPQVFPRLTALGTATEGDGIEVKVHFTKKQGAPVHFIPADNVAEAAAVREVDLMRKYRLSPAVLGKEVGLTTPKSAALRKLLKLDSDPTCLHVFEHGASRFLHYSDKALAAMRAWLKENDIAVAWDTRNASSS